MNEFRRPLIVNCALCLLLLQTAVTIALSIVVVQQAPPEQSRVILWSLMSALILLQLFIIYHLSQCRNWARWLTLAVLALSVLDLITATEPTPGDGLVIPLLWVAEGLFILSALLLIAPQSNAWFRQGRSNPG